MAHPYILSYLRISPPLAYLPAACGHASRSACEIVQMKKFFLIKAPILGGDHYWLGPGRGNTTRIWEAYHYPEARALELLDKEPLLKLIPVDENGNVKNL